MISMTEKEEAGRWAAERAEEAGRLSRSRLLKTTLHERRQNKYREGNQLMCCLLDQQPKQNAQLWSTLN